MEGHNPEPVCARSKGHEKEKWAGQIGVINPGMGQ